MARTVHLHGSVAGDLGTVRDHAQAHDVCAERRHRCSTNGGAAGADRGERNWDYRYTWVRDASFSVYALLGMGFTAEAAALGRWLSARVDEQIGGEGGPLNIMYRVDGSSDLIEEILPHWEGYRGSSPVRIGNGAADQLQLDIYGEAIDSLYFANQHGLEGGHQGWRRLCDILNCSPTTGTSRRRGSGKLGAGRQEFTYGRLMSWVA